MTMSFNAFHRTHCWRDCYCWRCCCCCWRRWPWRRPPASSWPRSHPLAFGTSPCSGCRGGKPDPGSSTQCPRRSWKRGCKSQFQSNKPPRCDGKRVDFRVQTSFLRTEITVGARAAFMSRDMRRSYSFKLSSYLCACFVMQSTKADSQIRSKP